jgi:hypothetical protein
MSELGIYEPTWNTGTLYGGDWSTTTSALARQLSTFTLVLIGALLLLVVLMLLVGSRSKPAEAPSARRSPGDRSADGAYALAAPAVSPFGPVQEVALSLAPAASPAPVALQTSEAGPASASLSPTDLIALTALRARIQDGQVSERATAAQRLAFARWLAEHQRISS